MSFDYFSELKKVFHEVLSLDQDDFNLQTSMQNTQAWDSLQHMMLILKIEDHFGLKFEVFEIIELNSVEKILECLNLKKAS